MPIKFFPKKLWVKLVLLFCLIVAIAMIVLYQYAIRHAASFLSQLVYEKSDGKVALEIRKVKVKWFANTVLLENAHLYNTEREVEDTHYDFHIEQLSLRMTDMVGLFFREEFYVDRLLLQKPRIVVETPSPAFQRKGSLSTEAGNVFRSIQEGLSKIQFNNFSINEGSFSLIQPTDSVPVSLLLTKFNLNIENFDPSGNTDGQFLFSDNIYFETFDQNFIFPDGRYRIAFKKLSIGTNDRFFALDSCTIATVHKQQQREDIDLYFDTLKLSGLDFNALYLNSYIRADSMSGINPHLMLSLDLNPVSGNQKSPLDSVFYALGVNLDLKFAGMKNLSTRITAEKGGKSSVFTTNGDDIAIRNLKVNAADNEPFSIEQFELALRDYTSFTADSLYQLRFDSVKFINSYVVLSNLRINNYKSKNIQESYHIPQFKLEGLDWEDLLLNQHLNAQKASLFRPTLVFDQKFKSAQENSKTLYEVFSDLNKFMYLDRIQIDDGNLRVRSFNNTVFDFREISCLVNITELLRAKTTSMIESSVEAFQFDKGNVSTAGLDLMVYNVFYNTEDTYFHIDSLTLNDDSANLNIHAKKVWLHNPYFDEVNAFLQLDSLKWEQGQLNYEQGERSEKGFPISVFIGYIQGAETHFDLYYNQRIEGFLNEINARNVEVNEEKLFKIQQVDATGRRLYLKDDDMEIYTQSFTISDHSASSFNNFRFAYYDDKDTLQVEAPRIDFMPGSTNLKQRVFDVQRLALYEPDIYYTKRNQAKRETAQRQTKLWQLHIDDLIFFQPHVQFLDIHPGRTDSILWHRNAHSAADSLWLQNSRLVMSEDVQVDIQALILKSNTFQLKYSFGIDFDYASQPVNAHIQRIELHKAAKATQWKWKGFLSVLQHQELKIGSVGLSDGNFWFQRGLYQSLWLNSEWPEPLTVLKNNPMFFAQLDNTRFIQEEHVLSWNRLYYRAADHVLNIESLLYAPSVDIPAFVRQLRWQDDYIVCSIPRMSIKGIDWVHQEEEWWNIAESIDIYRMHVNIYRDKTPPFDSLRYRALPAGMLESIGVPLKVDQIKLYESTAIYRELGLNKKDTGIIYFHDLSASITNVKNVSSAEGDSLKIIASAKLMGEIPVGLRFKQVYNEIENGFHLHAVTGMGQLDILNPAFKPLANIEVRSGNLKQIDIQARGTDHHAWGKMFLRYDKLKVMLFNVRKNRSAPLKSAIANAFVLNNRNKKHISNIYVERITSKSIFNYLVKIFANGAVSTVGLRNDRPNKKHIQQQDLRLDPLAIEYK